MPARPAPAPALLVTCEHGGNRVPPRYRGLFAAHARRLATHRGFDAGSLRMARDLSAGLGAALLSSTTTRLLVDLNRSLGHPQLFSDLTRALPRAARERLLEDHYLPYRQQVESWIASRKRPVVHVSSHSFTPELDAEVRNADIGLLYDPRRTRERALAARWKAALLALQPGLRVRFNYPYAGRADGLTAALRRRFPDGRYAGIELEINQRYPLAGGPAWRRLRRTVTAALVAALR